MAGFWVYDNGLFDKAVVHAHGCVYLEVAPQGGGDDETGGRWLGPFDTFAQARSVADDAGRERVANCRFCSPETALSAVPGIELADALVAAFTYCGTLQPDGGGMRYQGSRPRAGAVVLVSDGERILAVEPGSRIDLDAFVPAAEEPGAGAPRGGGPTAAVARAVAAGRTVEVWSAEPPALTWSGLPVDTAAGLIAALRVRFDIDG